MRQVSIQGGCLGALLLLGAQTAHAVIYLDQIDRLAAINAALLDYRPVAVPGPRPKGTIELGGELNPVPRVDNTIGANHEPVKAPPVGGQLRADWSPVSGIRLGMYLVPPVTVMHITAHLAGVEAEYGWKRDALVGSFRVFGSQGSVTGPFTSAGVEDRFKVRSAGTDLRLGWVTGAPVADWNWMTGVWTWYGGLGGGRNHTQFNIALDGAVIDGQRNYGYLFAGVGWTRGRWSLVAEQHRTMSYLNHIMFGVNYAY